MPVVGPYGGGGGGAAGLGVDNPPLRCMASAMTAVFFADSEQDDDDLKQDPDVDQAEQEVQRRDNEREKG
ncbi:hypothetical protein BH24ACT14_BH24ACT14_14870 [soil metagenome]